MIKPTLETEPELNWVKNKKTIRKYGAYAQSEMSISSTSALCDIIQSKKEKKNEHLRPSEAWADVHVLAYRIRNVYKWVL